MNVKALAALVFLAARLAADAAAQTAWYVDCSATGTATGLSWTDAFTDLQPALKVAAAGDQVWVAKCVYTPSNNDAAASYVLPDGVALYGGFAGGETELGQRDWIANETVLSGDIGHDDVVGSGQFWYVGWNRNTANSGHVIDASGVSPLAVVDGFTLANGATGPDGTPAGHPLMYGGGIYCVGGSPTVRNCTFTHNLAAFAAGGAMYVTDGAPSIENCRFLENYVHLGDGGGLYFGGSGAPLVRDSEFSRNVAISSSNGGQGAGLAHRSSGALTIERCLFDQNLARPFYAVGGEAGRGAGLWSFLAPVTVTDCTFTRNQATQGGGAFAFGPAAFTNCLFRDNKAVPHPNDPYPELGGDGAGIALLSFQGAQTAIINCTIAHNAGKKYSGVSAWQSATLVVENCVIWGNTATSPEFIGFWESQIAKAFNTIGYSCVQYIFGPPKLGEDPLEPEKRPGCIQTDPAFVGSGSYDLAAGSPCIDAARNSTVPPGVALDL
ncbi:MAG TPA: right-handed parallel beta-helix repeat-containing protein, partial [Phycisphaerae bacterium]|nr:right-handed parallel beta-helix repeat-containing protein [Phycisphaerae bacterium]